MFVYKYTEGLPLPPPYSLLSGPRSSLGVGQTGAAEDTAQQGDEGRVLSRLHTSVSLCLAHLTIVEYSQPTSQKPSRSHLLIFIFHCHYNFNHEYNLLCLLQSLSL